MTDRRPRIRLGEALRELLLRDRLADLVVLAYVVATVVTWIRPTYPGASNPYYVPFLYSGLVVLSLLWRMGDVQAPRERRFWIALTAGWIFWLVAEGLFVFHPPVTNLRALIQVFITAYYVCIVSAVEREPHVGELPSTATGLARLFSWPTVGFFVLALLVYLVLIPYAMGSDLEARLFEPVYFVVLDIYLLARFLLLLRRARTERWRTLYAALAVPVAITLLTDLTIAGDTVFSWGFRLPVWSWNLSYVSLALAVRMRHLPLAAGETGLSPFAAEEPSFLRSIQTLGFGIALPVVHISAYQLGIFEAVSRDVREIVAVLSLSFFGVLSLIKHRVLERRAQALWLERLAFESKLRDSTQDLRLMVERQRAVEAARQAEERFVFAFHSCPYGLAIASRKEGRLLEVNPALQETLASPREELLECSAAELGFRPQAPDPAGEGAATRWRRIRFRKKAGGIGRALACSVRVEAQEEECVLWILREVTAHEEELVRLEEAVALFDAAPQGVARRLGQSSGGR